MSLNKHTKAELFEMLSSRGIDAKSSMKKAELIELLENASAPATEPEANTKSEAKPSASQPAFLVVGVFIALAILAWIIL